MINTDHPLRVAIAGLGFGESVHIPASLSNKKEESIYRMRINCVTNKFKDISVNGKKNLSAKWEDPNGDKLLDDVISDSCKNV